jgi:RND family efflux transporter MFP subunit
MSPITRSSWGWIAAGVMLGGAAGAGAMYWAIRSQSPATTRPPAPAAATGAAGAAAITLSPDAVARAGLQIGSATSGDVATDLRVPGTVEANGYTLVAVTATASGRVTAVGAELGTVVKRGQVLGQIFAPEVADQQRVYLSMRAELEAVHARLARTEKLVALGSVSQQELEAARAAHTTHASDVEGARARLILLGVSADRLDKLTAATDISATMDILAPRDGTIIRRTANAGANVQAGDELLVVADLSTVWVVANVFERDLGRVATGSRVAMSNPAQPGTTLQSVISYLDPQVAPDTRTARLRADLPNPSGRLKLGQYVEVTILGVKSAAVMVPKEAVQTIADRQFVYVPDPAQPDRFVEREVRTGVTSARLTEILSGLATGDRVVTVGSFFLRAERDRLGLPLPQPPLTEATAQSVPPSHYDIAVTPQGFEPARITVPANVPVQLRFTRKTDQTCATAVSVPALKLKHDLPLNATVTISLPARPAGEIEFVCGMNMLKGTVVVR